MEIYQIILIVLAYWLIQSLEPWLAYPMIAQPLVLAPVVGLILGDLTQGAIIGATLQLVFLGVMGIGGTLPQDAAMGTVIGTSFAIALGQSTEVALTFAVPVSIASSFVSLFVFIIVGLFNPYIEKLASEGKSKQIEWMHRTIAFTGTIPKAIILFVTLSVGNQFAQAIVDGIPQIIIDGLTYSKGLMPAVGIALLLRVMWSKRMAVYYFAGVILVLFFGLNMLGVALSGVVIALVLALEVGVDTTKPVAHQSSDAKEELFND